MIPTKLILIEGLPGSGKSTMAQQLTWHLNECGVPASWIWEEQRPHPIFHSLDGLGQRPPAAAEALWGQLLRNWEEFGRQTAGAPGVQVLESGFFQTQIGFSHELGFSEEQILGQIAEVERALAPAHPVMIRFHQNDVDAASRRMLRERGPAFEQYLIAHLNTVFRRPDSEPIEGVEGLVAQFKRTGQGIERAYQALHMPKVTIENSAREWEEYRRAVTDFLDLPPMAPAPPVEAREDLIATWRRPGSPDELVVRADEQGLYLQDRNHRLIPQTQRLLLISAMPVELHLEHDASGHASTITITGPLADLPQTWHRA